MWGVGSGKWEVGSFLDILRTIDKKFKCLKFQIPKGYFKRKIFQST